jgi:hypothetical protein
MEKSFPKEITRRSAYIHILDLHKDGHIKPHIDATRVIFEHWIFNWIAF